MAADGARGQRVLAIGECMAEFAPAETPGTYRLGFAGDTFNTAWYLARLRPDIAIEFFTAIGTDPLSERLVAMAGDAGIDMSRSPVIEGRNVGLYLISLDEGERSFAYWRGQSAARHLADDPDVLDEALAAAGLVYVSGITLAILAPPARAGLLDALGRARKGGATIAFDPNLRPRLWEGDAQMRSAITEAAGTADIVLPSFDDEARWFGDRTPDATADRYAAAGAELVIVKNGASDVVYLAGPSRGRVSVPAVKSPVDSTAAGDSFNAAILAGLGDGGPIEDHIRRACRLAGAVVMGRGALVEVDPETLRGEAG